MGIIIKSPKEIEIMRQAGRIVAAILDLLRRRIEPGITTGELDAITVRELSGYGAVSSFKGYRGFPAHLCVSVNDELVHGIPGERVLCEGDIVSLDMGANVHGFHGDAALTVGVGKISPQAEALLQATEGARTAGIASARSGAHLSDISAAIQSFVEARGFSVVREYVGHGIGREMHEEPQIPNFGPRGQGPVLQRGMALALEPMVNIGGWQTKVGSDGWTVTTADGSLCAHFEHTIAITDGEPEILTRLD
ncbi:MAG: type I methionyl aminopeptidase [Dehalococcoidia bacterium]|nr:type I methionyl aminopeptidase [Dehalococcoidia bacterium]